ncbi:unnamed protein product [Auanema sp. JU1783]|nr:unnamed protein product [Auanema sp. JU1783]
MGSQYSHVSTRDPDDFLAGHVDGTKVVRNLGVKRRSVHSDAIGALVVIRSGLAISGSRDTTMVLHNVDNGDTIQKWYGHEGEVTKLAYGNKSAVHIVLSGSRDTTVKAWNFKSEAAQQTFEGHKLVVSGLCHLGDHQFMTGSRDCTVRIWDVNFATSLNYSQINRNLVTHMTYNPTTNLVAQSSEDKELKLWDPRSMTVSHRFPKRNHIQLHCEWTPDGGQIITSNNGFNGDGCEISIWDLRAKKLLRDLRGHEGNVTCVSYISQTKLPNKRILLSCSSDRTARIWNIEEGNCLWVEEMGTTSDLQQCVALGDTYAVVAGGNGLLCNMRIQYKVGKPYLQTISVQRNEKE